MIVEQHYDDEVIIGLLSETERDTHVPECDTCSGALETFRDLTGALRDDSVWDDRDISERPSPKTTHLLRAFAAQTKAEDAAAGPILAKLLAAPAELEQHPEWRTAGVVRRLLAYVDTINFTDPKAAVQFSTLAAGIAESIEANAYPF